MPYFETNDDVRLHYTEWGDGRPVVFCHSWGLEQRMWGYQIPDLVEAGMRCITYDRRGHGRSDVPGRGYDFDTLADDLAALVAHLELDRAVFVGHSLGCREIVHYARRHGLDRIARAAFVAPILPSLTTAFTAEQLAANAHALRNDVPGWCAANAATFFGDRNVAQWMVDWVARQIVDTPLPVLLATMAGHRVDFTDELRRFAVPTLVVHGDQDASAPLEHTGARVAEIVDDCELVVVPGAGHGLYAADHREVNARLTQWASDRASSRT